MVTSKSAASAAAAATATTTTTTIPRTTQKARAVTTRPKRASDAHTRPSLRSGSRHPRKRVSSSLAPAELWSLSSSSSTTTDTSDVVPRPPPPASCGATEPAPATLSHLHGSRSAATTRWHYLTEIAAHEIMVTQPSPPPSPRPSRRHRAPRDVPPSAGGMRPRRLPTASRWVGAPEDVATLFSTEDRSSDTTLTPTPAPPPRSPPRPPATAGENDRAPPSLCPPPFSVTEPNPATTPIPAALVLPRPDTSSSRLSFTTTALPFSVVPAHLQPRAPRRMPSGPPHGHDGGGGSQHRHPHPLLWLAPKPPPIGIPSPASPTLSSVYNERKLANQSRIGMKYKKKKVTAP